ncbi:hypothetical protein Tco_0024575 [Tanacetum coccineum]
MDKAESSAPKRSTVIRFRLPERRSTRLTPPALVPTVDKADEMILQDTLQVSLAEHKSREEQEARENVELVKEHLASVEIEKMVEGSENVIDDSLLPRNDESKILGTRLEPRSDKESPERRENGKIIEESRSTPFPTLIRSPRIHTDLVSLDTEKLQELTLQQQDIAIWLALQMKFESLQGENRAKRQKTSEYEAYVSGESSSRQVNENEQGPSTSGNQEQKDHYDFWTESYASDDDEIPTKQMSQDIMEEVSLIIDEAKLKKMATPLVQSCQRDPEAPPISLINQDLLYLKKGSSGPEKRVLWVNKYVKKFNPYARYGVENWKNPHAKIFYIRKQKEPGKPKEPDYKNLNKNDIEDMYLLIMNGKVPNYTETGLLWSLLVFIRSSVIWERVHDFQLGIESYQHKVNLTEPTISFPGIEKNKMFSIIYEPVHGIIYKNSKKEKRVMRHSEIHKFCDATLNIVIEGLKSYNNDVNYGYIQRDLNEDEVEYLKLFKEEIEVLQLDEKMGDVCE